MTPAAERIAAARRRAVNDPGPRYSVQRLAWVLSGCAGWHLRAIVWDMGWTNRTKPTGAEITAKAARSGNVRKVLSVYLADLEQALIARRSVAAGRLKATLETGPVLPDPSGEERMAGEFD